MKMRILTITCFFIQIQLFVCEVFVLMFYNIHSGFDFGHPKPSFVRHTRTERFDALIAINTISFYTMEYISILL
jgi:hypothetical protein